MFREKILSKNATIGIVGLGYVGLPLAIEFLKKGFKVLGFDVSTFKVDKLCAKESYIKHIPADAFSSFINSTFFAYTSFEKVQDCDAVIICVPTPLNKNKEPDMSFIINACNFIGPYIHADMLVSLESTTFPGTTKEVLVPILEQHSGLKAGRDFYVVFSPEREDPGNPRFTVKNIPKVVGGFDEVSKELGILLYSNAVEKVIPVSSTETAEITKLFENIYRTVNIALVNELKTVCHKMGINVWEVIEAAKTKPFGFHAFYPSPGCGGHCLTKKNIIFLKDKMESKFVVPISNIFDNQEQLNKVTILSYDLIINQLVWSPISAVSKSEGNFKLIRLYVEKDNYIEVTEDHPIITEELANNMFFSDKPRDTTKLAKDVLVGDKVFVASDFFSSNPKNTVSTKEIIKTEVVFKTEPIYSVEVENTHNFVTGYGVVVHNCLPCDPAYLSWKARQYDVYTHFIDLALELNTQMAYYTVDKVAEALGKHGKSINGNRVLIHGTAYKKDSDDLRDSPALKVIDILRERGAKVSFYDPNIPSIKMDDGSIMESVGDSFDPRFFDCIVIVTDHSNVDYVALRSNSRMIVDTRGVYALKDGKPTNYDNVVLA